MTEDEKKKMLADFRKPVRDDVNDDYLTDEDILEYAKQIIKKLGIEGKIANEKDLQ